MAKDKRKPSPPAAAAATLTIDTPPPAWLSAAAAELWPIVLDELRLRGQLDQVLARHVGLYCQTLARYFEAAGTVNAEGQLITTEKGDFISPALRVELMTLDRLRSLSKDLGLHETPDNPDAPITRLAQRLQAHRDN